MRDVSDEQLMRQYSAGEVSAFEELYRRYRGPLYRYFHRQVNNPATVNDLYQGCWEKLIGARKRYTASAAFPAWLFRIAHNHLVDHYRKTQRTEQLEPERLRAPGPRPEEVLEEHNQDKRFISALEELPADQRDALLLKVEAGLGLEEIAKITGVNRETVKSRLRYATEKLKRVLQS